MHIKIKTASKKSIEKPMMFNIFLSDVMQIPIKYKNPTTNALIKKHVPINATAFQQIDNVVIVLVF